MYLANLSRNARMEFLVVNNKVNLIHGFKDIGLFFKNNCSILNIYH